MLTSVLSIEPCAYAMYASTLSVEGYGSPIPAVSVFAHATVGTSATFFCKVSSGEHLPLIQRPAVTAPPRPRTLWCAKCRHLVASAAMLDERLGFRGYCDRCVELLAARCQRENGGRLPAAGAEFFCGTCPPQKAIHPLAMLCTPERDGRRRLRCRTCRLRQLRERRRLRRVRGSAYGR